MGREERRGESEGFVPSATAMIAWAIFPHHPSGICLSLVTDARSPTALLSQRHSSGVSKSGAQVWPTVSLTEARSKTPPSDPQTILAMYLIHSYA